MPPAVPANVLGLVASSFYLLFCWSYVLRGHSTPTWNRLTAFATAVAVMLAALATAVASSSTQAAENIGLLAMFISICMFAAPLSTLGQVLQEQSLELLPPVQCSMQFLSCFLWNVVGVNEKALPILVCNVLGLVLGAVQLGLIAVFPAGLCWLRSNWG
mmetsp:Transcript_114583/g.364183  ORF Transcript_114583/g.364183 Transcript_114583/m.364183 type:complete len:159 (+) Transcript_114583:320-796(+)